MPKYTHIMFNDKSFNDGGCLYFSGRLYRKAHAYIVLFAQYLTMYLICLRVCNAISKFEIKKLKIFPITYNHTGER